MGCTETPTPTLEPAWGPEDTNRAGIAHFWYSMSEHGPCIALCGRSSTRKHIQHESQTLRKCTRCAAAFAKKAAQ